MKATTPLIVAIAAALLVACSPKKEPKPNVDANAHASVAAANEGIPPVAPTGVAQSGETAATAPATQVAGKLPVIGPAPSWKLKDLNGKEISSDQFKGKVVVLDFWATWCPPCRAEIPGYVDLYKKYGPDKLVIIGASIDEGGPKVVQDFVTKFGVTYPVVMADEKVVSAFGGMDAVPTTFLIDRSGQIRDKKVGSEPTEEYEKKIKAALD